MDVLGACGSMVCHSAAMDVYADPAKPSSRIDFSERYLWSLATALNIDDEVVQDLFAKAKNDQVKNPKQKQTLILTLGRLARQCRNQKVLK